MHLSGVKTPSSVTEFKSVGSSYPDGRPQINLDFIDLYYPVQSRSQVNGRKQILQGVSGSFKFGELTAILGSSGAGKSTLLNIITGYVSANVGGSIRINGCPCQMSIFQKLSSYIMQDDLIQPYLTVEESMKIAANLKLGKEFSEDTKAEVIKQILETLGLENQIFTRTEKLSGGQKKRVSIALELINNPPVIFLDEPTSGLDIVSTAQVIQLLQKLARQGRTVICTLHQPSAFICQYFDHMYVMTRGCCVYQGSYQKLVAFMSHIGYDCPTTYNPADYIIEIIQGISKDDINTISQVVENGKLSIESLETENDSTNFRKVFRQERLSGHLDCVQSNLIHPIPFSQQFQILLKRKFKQQCRNLLAMAILLFHHILTGFLLGTTFRGVGKDASRPFENFKFLISVVVFFMYTNIMSPVLLFPIEIKLMKREYFNRWYGLRAYFAALSIASLPCQLLFGIFFIMISYIISSQPMDTSRIALFITTGLLLGYASEGWGLTVGSLFSSRNGSIVGPASIVPLLAVSVYGMGYGTAIQPLMRFLMSLSYLRYGVVGLTTSIYGQNRTLVCDHEKNVYCHYKDSLLLLKDLGMEETSISRQIIGLTVFLIFYRVTAYLGIRIILSLNRIFTSKAYNGTSKNNGYGRNSLSTKNFLCKLCHEYRICIWNGNFNGMTSGRSKTIKLQKFYETFLNNIDYLGENQKPQS